MEYKYLNLFLLFTITILLVMTFVLNTSSSGFQNPPEVDYTDVKEGIDDSPKIKASDSVMDDTDTFDDMYENLKNAEALCEELDERAENRKLLQQFKENHRVLELLTDQKKRIEELTNVVNYLRKEKFKRQSITNECRANEQNKINEDYKITKELLKNGLVDEPLELNIDLTPNMKKDLYNMAFKDTKCPQPNYDTYIDKEALRDKCVGCDVDKLSETNLKDFE